MPMRDDLPDAVRWVEAGPTRHRQIALLAAARPLKPFLHLGKDRSTRPVVPLDGGRSAWRLDLTWCEDAPRLLATEVSTLASRDPLPYGEVATYTLRFRRKDSYIRSMSLTGRLTPDDHACLLTAFAGHSAGVELSRFHPRPTPTLRVHLEAMTVATPLLVGGDGFSPFFEPNLPEVMDRIRTFLAEIGREDARLVPARPGPSR